jgi:hypothetical protein
MPTDQDICIRQNSFVRLLNSAYDAAWLMIATHHILSSHLDTRHMENLYLNRILLAAGDAVHGLAPASLFLDKL